MQLSDKERELLELLRQDSRETVSEMARKLGVSRPTLQNMLEKLEEVAIDRYTVKLKPGFANLGIRAFVLLNRDPRQSDAINAKLRSLKQISSVYSITGEYDLVVLIETDHYRDLERLISDIVTIEGVLRTHTYMVLAEKFAR